MSNKNSKPILVTGSHRSGSTWTGRMLSLSPKIAYIHEPFNPRHRKGICRAEFDHNFKYICDKNEKLFFDDIDNCINFKYCLSDEIKSLESSKDFFRLLRDSFSFNKNRILKKRPLVKDPIAFFSTPWLAKNFNMDVVVLIRHPAAFAGSLKIANWNLQFKHFLNQPLLMEHYLSEYKSDIKEYTRTKKDIVDQAILLWNLFHSVIFKYQREHPNWIFIKHETLSGNPVEEFGKLYDKLNIEYTAKVQKEINLFATANKEKQNSNQLKRDSKSNIWSWKTRLNNSEIQKIKENTGDIAVNFYSEEDWL